MKKYAVIVAGGIGNRMGTQVPKQFLLLCGKPVLWHTLEVFLNAYEELEIILVLPQEHMETGRTMVNAMQASHRISMVAGGATRFHSVRNGLSSIREESLIFVHDGVRCLLTEALIHRCYEEAMQFGSAIPVIVSKDSVRLITETGSEALERSRIKLVQTPQTFLSSLLLPAYDRDPEERFTDEASVVEAAGGSLHLVAGEINNIKITAPEDLALAEEMMRRIAQNEE